jgi:hypothetical protein
MPETIEKPADFVAAFESMPITAFYWHDDLESYVIERGDWLQYFNPEV